ALRAAVSSILFFDNVRTLIDPPLIEANCLSPLLSLRILGGSVLIESPNSYLWMITSNLTSGTVDIISRALPIRLRYEGNPRERAFEGDPAAYATRHRLEILGELAGLVERWKLAGRALGAKEKPRAPRSEVLGGLLGVGGRGSFFLGNVGEVRAAMGGGVQGMGGL